MFLFKEVPEPVPTQRFTSGDGEIPLTKPTLASRLRETSHESKFPDDIIKQMMISDISGIDESESKVEIHAIFGPSIQSFAIWHLKFRTRKMLTHSSHPNCQGHTFPFTLHLDQHLRHGTSNDHPIGEVLSYVVSARRCSKSWDPAVVMMLSESCLS